MHMKGLCLAVNSCFSLAVGAEPEELSESGAGTSLETLLNPRGCGEETRHCCDKAAGGQGWPGIPSFLSQT